jgi:type II secretion system protein N
MALQLPQLQLGPRTRKLLRYAGIVLLALVTFIFAFQMTFPYHRVKDKVVELLADKYEVTIGDVQRSIIPGRMYFKAVSLRTRPTEADDVASTLYIEQLEVGIGLFALLRGTAQVKMDAKIGPGHLRGSIGLAGSGTQVSMVGDDLPSVSLPMRELLGLPMSGKVRFDVELDLPNEKNKAGRVGPAWTKAEGSFELACPSGCSVGDGKSKLKPKLKNRGQQAFAEGGIEFGKVNIDSLLAVAQLKNGKLSVTKFDAKSTDGELHVDFEMAIAPDISASTVAGCLRFKGSESLQKREAKTFAAITTTGAPVGKDGLFHIKLDGPLREMRRLGLECSGGAAPSPSGSSSPNMDNPAGTPRPNLTVTPESPATPPAQVGPPTVQATVPPLQPVRPPGLPPATIPAGPPAAAPPAAAPPAAAPPAGDAGSAVRQWPPPVPTAPDGEIVPGPPAAPPPSPSPYPGSNPAPQ